MTKNSDSGSQSRVGAREILVEEEVLAAREVVNAPSFLHHPPPLTDHPPPLPLACPARDEEWSARSPSPLGGGALNGWRSAAPGPRGSQLQVRGAPLRRSGWAGQSCTLLRPSPPLLRQSQSSSSPPGGRGHCGRQRHRESHFSQRARPAQSLGAGSVCTGS